MFDEDEKLELGTTTTKRKCGNCPQQDGDRCIRFPKVKLGGPRDDHQRLIECMKQERKLKGLLR